MPAVSSSSHATLSPVTASNCSVMPKDSPVTFRMPMNIPATAQMRIRSTTAVPVETITPRISQSGTRRPL